jgi:BASS family bile acid:Na+ symporter
MELVLKAGSIFMLIFVVSTMLGMGLGLTVSEVVAPLRNVRLVVLALIANFVLIPVVAIAIGRLLQLDEPLYLGMVVLSAAGGAPFVPKLIDIARGNVALSVGLMVFLTAVTVLFLPLALPLMLPGVSVDSAKIAKSLVVTMAVPLVLGLCGKQWLPVVSARAKPALEKISTITLIVALVLSIWGNVKTILELFGERGILASILFIAIAYGLGWLLGGRELNTRRGLGMSTAGRNIGAAVVVANQNFDDPKVAVLVIIFTIVTLVLLIPLTRFHARRS